MHNLVISPTVCGRYRYYVIIVNFFGFVFCFAMRYCFSFALAHMADVPKKKVDPDSCPGDLNDNAKNKTAEFHWNSQTQGLLLSSFFFGYMVGIVPAGVLADLFGPRTILIIGSGVTSILTMLTPGAIYLGDWPLLLPLRIIIGIFQAMFYSPTHVIVANWAPKEERTCLGAIVFAGSLAGNFFQSIISGILLGVLQLHWQWAFYVFGILGLAWTFVFAFTVHGSPTTHHKLLEKEKEKFVGMKPHGKVKKRVPWLSIMKSHPFWAMMIGHIGHHWGFTALVTVMPLFFKSVLHMNIKKNTFINAAIYVVIWAVSLFSGWFLQLCEGKHWITKTMSRKIGTTLSSSVPALGLIGGVYSGCDRTMAVSFVIVGQALMGFYYSSLKINTIDLSPNFAGSLGSLTVLLAGIVGIILPYVFGVMTPNYFLAEWRIAMWVSFAIMVGTNIYYVFPASAEAQPWDKVEVIESEKPPETEAPK